MTRFVWLSRKSQVLHDRDFSLFFVGYVSSLLGSSMSTVATAWAVLDVDAGATALGAVMAAAVIPRVALMAFAGAVADRYGRRRVMLAADILRTFAQTMLAVALISPVPFGNKAPLWLFIVLTALRGTGQAFFSPALSALTAEIAPRNLLGDANAMFQLAKSTSTIAGPALGGVLVALTNPGFVVAIDAGSYGVSVLSLGLLHLPAAVAGTRRLVAPTSGIEGADATLRQEMSDGWREFRSRTWLWSITVQFAFFNLITWSPWMVLGPVAARQYLGGAPAWGIIMTCEGVGAIIAGLFLLGRRPRKPVRLAMWGALCYALPDIPMTFHTPAQWVAVTALLSGGGSTVFGVYLSAAMQQNVPSDKLARVSAFTDFPAFGIGVIGYIIDGTLAATFGATTVFAVGAAYGVISTLVMLCLPVTRSVNWNEKRIPASGIPADCIEIVEPTIERT